LNELLDKEFDSARRPDRRRRLASVSALESQLRNLLSPAAPGGAYLLEDWAWAHAAGDWQRSDHIWPAIAHSNLVFD
jgi:hypothetical protein